ncbi:hypothetical protein [Spirulina subsalsa]|uniref:hypothetical protein n=1 Tax=Spirulina subsalsa TaxID=54311 RepID=UPI0003129D1E|nr:hypothetical protein [Spirulina subsalsa]
MTWGGVGLRYRFAQPTGGFRGGVGLRYRFTQPTGFSGGVGLRYRFTQPTGGFRGGVGLRYRFTQPTGVFGGFSGGGGWLPKLETLLLWISLENYRMEIHGE